MPTNSDEVVLLIDDSDVQRAVDRSNRGVRSIEKEATTAGTGISRGFRAAGEGISAFERVVQRATTRVTEFGTSSVIFKLFGGAVGSATRELESHMSATDKLIAAYRGVRLALSPTLFTGLSLAIGAAVTATIELVAARKALYDQESLQAAKTKVSFTDAATLGVLERVSGPENKIFSGLTAAKIREIAVEFEGLEDPADRANRAFQLFGSNADKALELLNPRLKEAVDRSYELAEAIDSKTRIALRQMGEELHAPISQLEQAWDTLKGFIETAKTKIVVNIATVWEKGESLNERINEAARKRLEANPSLRQKFLIPEPEPKIPSDLEFAAGFADQFDANSVIKANVPSYRASAALTNAPVARAQAIADQYANSIEGVRSRLASRSADFESLLKHAGEPLSAGPLLVAQREMEGLKAHLQSLEEERALWETFVEKFGQTLKHQTEIQNEALNKQISGAQELRRLSSYKQLGPIFGPEIEAVETAGPRTFANGISVPGNLFQASMHDLALPHRKTQDEQAEELTAEEKVRMASQRAADDRHIGYLEREERLQQTLNKLSEDGVDAIDQSYQLRVSLAEKVYDIQRRDVGDQVAGYERLKSLDEARIERAEKLAELQKKQFDSIKSEASSLFETLITKPSQFGSQLAAKLKEAIIRPIADGFGALIAEKLQPVIYGKDGKSGIAGALGGIFGKRSGIQDVQLVNGGTVPVTVMNLPGASGDGGGGYGTAVARRYPTAAAAMAGLALAGGLAAGPRSSVSEVIGGGDSTAGLTQLPSGLWQRGPGTTLSDLWNLPGRSNTNPLSALGKIFGGGGGGTPSFMGDDAMGPTTPGFGGGYPLGGGSNASSARGGLGGLLDALKGGLGGLTRSGDVGKPGEDGEEGTDLGAKGGSITGVDGLAGGALLAGGLALGLDGWKRGGGIGALELAGGGAAIGFKFGGPIGAAIGAGIGGAIGLGKWAFGGDDDFTHASKLVRQAYAIDIPKNSSTIKQIVSLAHESFGGSISRAVQSPQVRQLIQLYAESTGQRSNLFAGNPVAAHLVEQGGGLFQGPTYNNGTGYSFASSLPTLGNAGGGIIPSGNPYQGGSLPIVHVSLDPQQTANLWQTGTAAAIAGNPNMVAQSASSGYQSSAARYSSGSALLAPTTIFG